MNRHDLPTNEPSWLADPRAYLTELGQGPDDGFDPGEAALAFSALGRPTAALGQCMAHLDTLAKDVELAAEDAENALDRARALASIVYEKCGYAGDTLTYEDMQNADLARVIDRRKGLPVALGILHMSIAYKLGWTVEGLAFPSHFLLRLDYNGERLALDPFDRARVLNAADMRDLLKRVQGDGAELSAAHYQPVSNRAVLLRLQNNIKLRRLHMVDINGALGVVEAMSTFAPGVVELISEAALLNMRLENIGEAIRCFERYLAAEPDEALRQKTAQLLEDLKRRLN